MAVVLDNSAAYLSCKAAMKLTGASAGLVGRMKDAGVAKRERPSLGS